MVYSYKWEGPKHTGNPKKYFQLEIKVEEEEPGSVTSLGRKGEGSKDSNCYR